MQIIIQKPDKRNAIKTSDKFQDVVFSELMEGTEFQVKNEIWELLKKTRSKVLIRRVR